MTEEVRVMRPRTIPTRVLPISEEVGEENLLGHSLYWSWCPHCVDGHGVGQRHVPFEVESGALPMIVMD